MLLKKTSNRSLALTVTDRLTALPLPLHLSMTKLVALLLQIGRAMLWQCFVSDSLSVVSFNRAVFYYC